MVLTPQPWNDYQLLDSGNFEKLERFGKFIVARPEPQALWQKKSETALWDSAHARFVRTHPNSHPDSDRESGKWHTQQTMPQRWTIDYRYRKMSIKLRLGLTAFKHVGVFPEQASNWNFIYDQLTEFKEEKPSVLNLFAYTGAASLAAKAAGADVTHLDSVRQVVSWANDNMALSNLTDIRWVVEDATKFCKREINRAHKYHAIIIDPPAYGRGPDGEKWTLPQCLPQLLSMCAKLLHTNPCFILMNLYSLGYSPLIARNLLDDFFPNTTIECGELAIPETHSSRLLPLSTFARIAFQY
jgi:23S rRNA (cytosine1962-C5)-methyltransferase